MQDRTIEMDEAISRFVNSISQSEIPELGEAMARDHRTLQQSKFRMCLSFIEQLAIAYDNGHYDLRNEAACKAASKMFKALSEVDKAIPFV